MFERLIAPWTAPLVPEDIPHGDMPGDKICVQPEHIAKAAVLFPAIRHALFEQLNVHPQHRAVLSVCGGSGVGKSEIASVLAYFLNQIGVGAYILSGDNYPHRIPKENDRERVRVFRCGGLRGLIDSGCYQPFMKDILRALWRDEMDADPAQTVAYPWLAIYQAAGRCRLGSYLGTRNEIDFDEVSSIIARFKQGDDTLLLKRMGRESSELWYDAVDVSAISVLLIEWTHGNSDYIQGVDMPVFLHSTPAQTLAHRRARQRDGQTDSAFTTMVLDIEQRQLRHQAGKAKLILSKSGELLTYAAYQRLAADE